MARWEYEDTYHVQRLYEYVKITEWVECSAEFAAYKSVYGFKVRLIGGD